MRILHTADWHLGLRLYKKEIHEEHRLFLDWLLQLIRERRIDVLLIAGDIFDQANPSNETRALYYSILKELIQVKCRVIITGGNHDSPGILNAPREILEMLDITVVGSMPEDIHNEIIELRDAKGALQAIVAAVPYLREPDIHALTREQEYADKGEQIRDAIRIHYSLIAELCKPFGVPVIAMGHLYAAGSSTCDSERLIQMGNQSPVASEDLDHFSYLALGHIHRPQFVAGRKHIRYSGSPVPLSFSERDDRKMVIELEIRNGQVEQSEHEVPVFRKLVRFNGSLEEVQKKLKNYKNDGQLKAFGELHITEQSISPAVYADTARFVGDWESEEITILNYGITNTMATAGITELMGGADLREIRPLDVLEKVMERGSVSDADRELLRAAFLELLDMDDETEEA